MQVIKKIGIFDSGAGGLSVVKSLIEEFCFEHVIYYGDTARVPYGNKDSETIRRFSLDALEFFSQFKLDLLVVACNTASAHALIAMQEQAKIPIIGVIESGVIALEQKHIAKHKHILVLATEATIRSQSYEKKLQELGYSNITSIPTNLFVGLVEENIYEGMVVDSVFRHYFEPSLQPDAVILGCTHFPLLLKSLQNFFGKDTLFIHSGEAIADFLRNNFVITENIYTKPNAITFFASDNVEKLKNTARLWLKPDTYIFIE